MCWLPRTDGDGGEARREAVEEALARVVADQRLADEFLRAVRALGRREDGLVDYGGEGLAVDCLGRSVDHPDELFLFGV